MAVIALITFAVAVSAKSGATALSAAPFFIVPLVIIAAMSTTIIPPRTIGVAIALGKPVGVLSNGFHFKQPWAKVEKFDASIQNNIYRGDNAITVRLGNNSQALADVSVQWQMKTDNAEQLALDYKTFESIQSNLVDRNLRASLNEVMGTYNPLASVDSANKNTSGDFSELAEKVRVALEDKVGADISVKSVTIPIIDFDQSTQDKINELQAEIARTRIAEQKKETAGAEKQANEILESSVSDNVLTSKCLDIIERSGQSPLGCFPGSAGQPIIGK